MHAEYSIVLYSYTSRDWLYEAIDVQAPLQSLKPTTGGVHDGQKRFCKLQQLHLSV